MSDEERYEIKGKLGEGGRGSVYEAYDKQLNRKVAIKRLHPGEEMDPEEAYQTVLKESHALSALNAPNIVRVFDVGQDTDGPYVVMEHLDGKTLHEVVGRAPLVEADFFAIAEQSLEALVAAHAAGMLHRDIKPANLVLTWLPSGRIMLKLLDFGLAKFTTSPAVQTIAHGSSVFGSIYFMAPEQFDRQPLDERTDLYSLGCVLYFSLTGTYPFNGENVTEVMASHVTGNCADLKNERPDLPPALCDWIMTLLAKDPADRPRSAQSALDDLEAFRKQSLARTSAIPTQTGAVAAAPGPLTSTAPVATAPVARVISADTRAIPTGTVPTALNSSSGGMPKWFFPTAGILTIFILGLGAAIMFRPDPDTPRPPDLPPEEATVLSPEKADKAEEARIAAVEAEIAASHQPVPQQKKGPQNIDFPRRFFNQRDKNKDGELTYNEYLPTFDAALRKSERKRFDNFDLDKNGTVNLAEIREKGWGITQFFVRDKNGDARLTLKEWLSLRSDKEKVREDQTKIFNEKDADQDGFMTLKEHRARTKPPGEAPSGK